MLSLSLTRVAPTTWPHGTPSSATTLVRSLSCAGSSAASEAMQAASATAVISIRAWIRRFIAFLPVRSDCRELDRVREDSPYCFARRRDGVREWRVGILQQREHFHHQPIIGLSQLR